MTPAQKVETAQRVYAFKLYCLHLTAKEIARQLTLTPPVVRKWIRQDEWEVRRAALVGIEVVPAWAVDLFERLAKQGKRLAQLEHQLLDLGAPAADTSFIPNLLPES
jgi:uncharacterized protein YjcR